MACLAAAAVLSRSLLASFLVLESVGIDTLLMLSTPVFLADSTSVTVDALLMSVLALSAAVLACSFTACFSSTVRLGAASIELFFLTKAPSIAALAASLLIATVPLLTALVTASLKSALSMSSLAALASVSTWLLAACFSLSVRPLVLSIASFLALAALSMASLAACLTWESSGTLIPLMLLTPLVCACLTASLS